MSNELKISVCEAATGIYNTVTHGISYVASASQAASVGIGETVHHLSSSMQRLITSPPENPEDLLSSPESPHLPCTPVFGPQESDSSHASEPSSFADSVNAELGISENYFKKPEVYEVASNAKSEEIKEAIDNCKELILSCEESSNRRRLLVHRLIQLRLCYETLKEDEESASMGIHIVKGHRMKSVLSYVQRSTKQNCDKCTHIIWGILHVMYQCELCGYQSHRKCLDLVNRRCSSLLFNERPNFIFKICPERGLAAQNFRCSECNLSITGKTAWTESQICDYTGLYYCAVCHWGRTSAIPARIVHNWDFDEYPVCQKTYQLLHYMSPKPLIYLEDLNPHLFLLVDDLQAVKKTRRELILMKPYLRTCRAAQDARLLRLLDAHQHFVEEPHCYSLKDLIDLHNGSLMPFLMKAHKEFYTHIKETCQTCQGKGFICELCKNKNVIFPFDSDVANCPQCQASFHAICFSGKDCPRCLRLKSRSAFLEQQDLSEEL